VTEMQTIVNTDMLSPIRFQTPNFKYFQSEIWLNAHISHKDLCQSKVQLSFTSWCCRMCGRNGIWPVQVLP